MTRWQPIDDLLEEEMPSDQGIYLRIDMPQTREDRRRLRDSERQGNPRGKQPRSDRRGSKDRDKDRA